MCIRCCCSCFFQREPLLTSNPTEKEPPPQQDDVVPFNYDQYLETGTPFSDEENVDGATENYQPLRSSPHPGRIS